MSNTDPLVLDHEAWNLSELIEHILTRHFNLGDEAIGGIAWQVRSRDGGDESESLLHVNRSLESLGWVAMLDEGDPPILSVAPRPIEQLLLPNWQLLSIWSMMSVFLTFVGSAWLLQFDADAGAFDPEILRQAVLYFTLPVVLTMALASEIRRRAAARFDINIGHLVPIVFPILSPIWPFGIAGLLSQRRSDLFLVPNRRALGIIELATPLTLFLSGTVLTVIGLALTPNEPPEISALPIAFQNNPLLTILVMDWLGADLWIRLQWLHPTALAGIGLSVVGWASLLPIPGFPGDRMLHAIIGPAEMSDSKRQTSLFILMLGVMVLVFVETEYWPWLLIAAIGTMRRFSTENTPPPIIVDESKGLSDVSRKQLVAAMLIVLIAGFPGMYPTYQIADWDAGLDTSNWATELQLTTDEPIELTLDLTPAGVIPVSGWLQFRIEGSTDDWRIESDCQLEREVCRFDGVTQSSPSEVNLTISQATNGQYDLNPLRLTIFIDVEGREAEHAIILMPIGITAPIDPLWLLIEETETPRICLSVDVTSGDSGVLALSNPFWEFEGETNLSSSGTHDVCLRGHEGALRSSTFFDSFNRVMGPVLSFERDNGSDSNWWMAVNGSEAILTISDLDWEYPLWFAATETVTFAYADDGTASCPSTDVIVEMDTSGEWNWTFAERSAIRIPAGVAAHGRLYFAAEGWLAICLETTMLGSYRVLEGVDVMTRPGRIGQAITVPPFGIVFSIVNREDRNLPISVEWTGDSPEADVWEVTIPDEVGADSEVDVTILAVGELALERVVWVTVGEDIVTVHLAARCPVDGCEAS
ncbi:MAG TPA: hypothetical protein EYG23_01490 [Candidatus Poseidoniales archaeon]|nr:hypothetical protein [Candidatus Poseidoniales archaeon]